MLAVVIVCLLAVIGLAVVVWRQQAAADVLRARIEELTGELDAADNEVTEALTATARAERARDDALERVHRARRDASEVAGRLRDESEARQVAERRIVELEAELDVARAPSGDDRLARLWALALAGTERTWRTSVAIDPDAAPPLGAGDRLPVREAIEIEIDAAREEAGADIDLQWRVDDAIGLADAVLVLVTARELVASVAKTAAHTVLTVEQSAAGIEVAVDARDDHDAEIAVAIPGVDAEAPGRYRVAAG